MRCGLALLELGRVLGAEVQAAHQHAGVNVRVGLHTGGVLLGGGVDADASIRGIAVNIAARMEQTAPAGAMRISHDTYAQVRGLFEVAAQEPLVVKGVDTPIQSYLVLRAKPRNFRIGSRGIEGITTRMIGRDAGLKVLQAAFKRLLRDILAWRLQIADDDSVEAARAKMEQGIVPLFIDDDGPDNAEGHAHLLGHLIGIEWKNSRHIRGILDDPRQIRNRAFHAAAQIFRRVSASDGSPVVLELEDLHWADSESLDFLNYLCKVNGDVPLPVLAFTRPTQFERRSEGLIDQGRTQGIHQRIALAPLGKDMSRLLAGELLKKLPEMPAALRELLTSSAEGNPFYMEELLKMLIDQGAISVGDTWAVNANRLLLTKVPPTLTGVLQARLDGLREYAFSHQLLHQVTYDTVLKHAKREGHAKAAQWLAALTAQGGLRAGDLLGLAAEHFEQAGDAAHAAEFHVRAAEHAGQRLAHQRVLAHVGRALALLGAPQPAQAELRWRLLKAREVTLNPQARRDEQAADLDALAQAADMLDDDGRRACAAWRRCIRAMHSADWATLEGVARHGLACATRAGDDGLRLHALRRLAIARVYQGDIEAGRALALQGLAEARSLGLRGAQARLLTVLVLAAEQQGGTVSVLDLNRQSLQIHRETGDRVNEGISLLNLGGGWLSPGDLAQAQRDLDTALQMVRANGDRVTEDATLVALSALALCQGDATQALALARWALDITVAAQERAMEVVAGLRLGNALLALGRGAAARQAHTQALAGALEINDPTRHDASAGLARVALADADADAAAALAAVQPVLDHVASGGTLDGTDWPRQIELACHQALARAGDPRAAAWLARAHSALMAQADAITDVKVRQGFLHHIPHRRAIVAAWSLMPC